MDFYILRLKISGIKNIEKPVEFNFYKKTINNDFNPEDYRIKAIYGENGSGKTAIMYSVKLMQNFILNGSYLADNDTQKALSEIINKKTRKGMIECEFYVNADDSKEIMQYSIEFGIKSDERVYILKEELYRKNGRYSKNKYSLVFSSENGVLTELEDKQVYEYLKEKSLNLLDKQSVPISILNNTEVLEKIRNTKAFIYYIMPVIFGLYIFVSIDEADKHTNYVLRERIRRIDSNGSMEKEGDTIRRLADRILDSAEEERFILKEKIDEYEQRVSRKADFIRLFKTDLREIEIEKKDRDKFYECSLKMVYDDYSLDSEFESRGIKKLLNLFKYLDAASGGYIVFIDELDSNINDVYLDKLIEYFIYYGKGQLCFTSHNLSPMSVLKGNKSSISFISSINTVHTWANSGNLSPERAYKNGFIEDSPFNVDASDFLGILGESDE